jgi:hypothetical protein
LVEQFIQKIENDKATKDLEEQNNRARIDLENQEEESRRLQARLEEDKKRRAYNKWYSNLSDEKKATEDKRKEDETRAADEAERESERIEACEEVDRQLRLEEERKEELIIQEKKERKNVTGMIVLACVIGVIGAAVETFNIFWLILINDSLNTPTTPDVTKSNEQMRSLYILFTIVNAIIVIAAVLILIISSIKHFEKKWKKPYKTKKKGGKL